MKKGFQAHSTLFSTSFSLIKDSVGLRHLVVRKHHHRPSRDLALRRPTQERHVLEDANDATDGVLAQETVPIPGILYSRSGILPASLSPVDPLPTHQCLPQFSTRTLALPRATAAPGRHSTRAA